MAISFQPTLTNQHVQPTNNDNNVSPRCPTCQALNWCFLFRIYTKWVPEAISKQFVPGSNSYEGKLEASETPNPRKIRQIFCSSNFLEPQKTHQKPVFLRVEWVFRLDLYADHWSSFHVLLLGVRLVNRLCDSTGELCRAAPIVSIPADGEGPNHGAICIEMH